MTSAGSEPARLRIVRGQPTDAELAAVVTVLSALARAGPTGSAARAPTSGWLDRCALLAAPPPAGRGAWRRSALPR
ncbi:MAG: acyl-CoA carboxylase subunit epsilon [Mycobacteriales bacterium]|nr:MAG: hypothetical protein DLM56_03985 [Pseudonocardiales bacterium]